MGSRFKVLGRTQLLIGDHFNGQWATPKVRGILGALLLQPQQSVSIDDLIRWVWPEDAERPRSSTFHTYAARIREALRQMDSPPELIPDRGAYRIEVDRADVDIFEFLGHVGRGRMLGRQGDHAAACDALRSGMAIWSGRPLSDLDGERARNWRRATTEETWLPAQSELMRELSALGEFTEVLRRLQDLPAEYLTNLLIVERRLEALHGLHRVRDATDYFLRMRKRLLTDCGQDEADELTRFNDTLLRRVDTARTPEPDAVTNPTEPAPRIPRLLPRDIPHLVGRDQLLTELDAVAPTPSGAPVNRIVLLDGPPGIGKTALAVHWAHRVLDRFPGGYLFMDLNGGGEGPRLETTTVVDRFLAELDFPAERITTAEGRASKLRSLLSGRRALVILDDAASTEHVLPLVDCLPCHVLITSRRRLTGLGRRGATTVSVAPLSYWDTTSWLADRVGARALGEPDQLTALATMCAGHALMLHVVAQHVIGRPRVRLAEFVDELRDAQDLLDLGDDTDNPGGSVQAAFAMAYRSLDTAERRLFALLGVHPGPDVSMDAAAALAGGEVKSVRRLLDDLVDAHLLTQPEVRGRYRFHELLRVFAARCASADEYHADMPAAVQRMLNFYHRTVHNADTRLFPNRSELPMPRLVDGVSPISFTDDATAVGWCARERVNLNSVIRFSSNNGFYDTATQMASSTGEILQRLGYHEEIVASLEVAIQSATRTHDRLGLGYSHNNMGVTLLNQRRFEKARSHLVIAQQLYDEVGDRTGSIVARYNLARIRVEQGEYRRGIEGLLAALAAFREIGAAGPEVVVLYRLADAHRRVHDLDMAISFARDGQWLAEKLGDEMNQGTNLTELCWAYYDKGDLPSAKGYAERALAIHTRLNGLVDAGRTSMVLAAVHRDQRDLPAAERHGRLAVTFCHNGRGTRYEAVASDMLAEILHAQARHDEAFEFWSKSLAIFDDLGDARAHSVRSRLAELAATLPIVTPEQTRPLMRRPSEVTPPPAS